MRVVGLCRVSTDAQADSGSSIPEQRQAIQAYCERHGFTLIETCVDDGVSGRFLERPAVRRALELARAGSVDAVLLTKLDRLGRENRVIQTLLHSFAQAGVQVLFTEHASGDSAPNRLLNNVLGGVAEFEHAQILDRTRKGRIQKALGGRYPQNYEVLGYHVVRKWEEHANPANRSGTFRVIEREAELVRLIFDLYASGLTLPAVAASLNSAGHVTKSGAAWNQPRVREVLRNRAYIGEAVWGKRKWASREEDGRERRSYKKTEPETWYRVPCPALVEREVWDKAEARLSASVARFPGRHTNRYLLRGVVFCGRCKREDGTPRAAVGYVGGTKGRPSYQLPRYRCGACHISRQAGELENLVRAAVLANVKRGTWGRRARERAKKRRASLADPEEVVERFEDELRALDQEERKLLSVAIHFSPHLIEEQASRIRTRKAHAQAELQKALGEIEAAVDPDEAARDAERESAEVRNLLTDPRADRDTVQRLYQSLVRVTLWPGSHPTVEVGGVRTP